MCWKILTQAKRVNLIKDIVAEKTVKVQPSIFLNWITAQPPARTRVVISVTIVHQVYGIVVIPGRKPERVIQSDGLSRDSQQVPERSVFVTRRDGSWRSTFTRYQTRNVPITVIRWEVCFCAAPCDSSPEHEESADTARAAGSPAQVCPPHVSLEECLVRLQRRHALPAVINENQIGCSRSVRGR